MYILSQNIFENTLLIIQGEITYRLSKSFWSKNLKINTLKFQKCVIFIFLFLNFKELISRLREFYVF